MNEYAAAILKAGPKLEEAAGRLQKRIERLACGLRGDTMRVINRIYSLIELKRGLCDAAEAYRRLSGCMNAKERTALTERLGGVEEQAIADQMGICRNTVIATVRRAGQKCDMAVDAMVKSGLDPVAFRASLAYAGGFRVQDPLRV